jgi:hypothetical protein
MTASGRLLPLSVRQQPTRCGPSRSISNRIFISSKIVDSLPFALRRAQQCRESSS